MNRFLQWLRPRSVAVPETKAHPMFAFHGPGEASWSFAGEGALAREGFARNPVVYRCVRMVAEAAATLPLVLREDEAEISAHPLLELLAKPSAHLAGRQFLERLYGHVLVSGNAYVHALTLDGAPRELHLLRPDRVEAVTDPAGWPIAYVYAVGGKRMRIEAEGDPALIRHVALFNPLDDCMGLPPLAAAHMALDIHNAASRWNKALLDNSARPSGALVYSAAQGGNLTEDRFDRLKAELEEGYSGATRAGRPMLLEGGLDWKAMGYSPRDMDFIQARNGAARDIALAFGVPPMLLGIPGDNTYSNFQEASCALWRQTVLPLAARVTISLGAWLAAFYRDGQTGAALSLDVDADNVEALATEREALWRRLNEAGFLSDAEKRAAAGYEPRGEPDEFSLKFDPNQPRVPPGNPDGGQWTDGGGGGGGGGPEPDDEPFEVAQNHSPSRVDLLEEEAKGGHAIKDHVGKTETYLLGSVAGEGHFITPFLQQRRYRHGSFPSMAAATKLVNATLSRNAAQLETVASGAIKGRVLLKSKFKSKTGIEAFKSPHSRRPPICVTPLLWVS